jgi:sec-independent protein translocase protein TatB
MFGFSWSEILIIGVVALVFIGPNDLPKAMKTAARWMSAARKLAREFQSHVDDLVREAELDELREQARKLATQPLSSLEAAVDPDRVISKALAAPDDLHELMTGTSPVTPVAEPAELPPLVTPSEPTAAVAPAEAATQEATPIAQAKQGSAQAEDGAAVEPKTPGNPSATKDKQAPAE